jgi:hypothetical protein
MLAAMVAALEKSSFRRETIVSTFLLVRLGLLP